MADTSGLYYSLVSKQILASKIRSSSESVEDTGNTGNVSQ
ncbi:unnamed protein product [Nippostrongylus brasiliensis]|nr:unnamed protein product [Nippostrongylus brasiliensis]